MILATGSVAKPLLDLQFGGRILDTAGMWLLNEQPSAGGDRRRTRHGDRLGPGAARHRGAAARGATRSCRWRTRTSHGARGDQEAERADRDRGEGRGRFGFRLRRRGVAARRPRSTTWSSPPAAPRTWRGWAGRGGDRARRPRADQGRWPAAHVTPAVAPSATWSPGLRWPTRRRTRGSSRRGRGRARGPRDRLHVRAGGDVLLPAGGLLRLD